MYRKVRGATTTKGQQYEYGLVGLILLRILPWAHMFKIGSNVEGLGKFDDVFLKVMPSEGQKFKVLCIQLKHKQKLCTIPKSQLLTSSGDFSLETYYHSYCEVMKLISISRNESDIFYECCEEDVTFVIFTNSFIEHSSPNFSVEEMTKLDMVLNTGGNKNANATVFSFSPDDEDIWSLRNEIGDKEEYHSFLRKLKFFSGQTNASVLGQLVEEEVVALSANITLALPFLKSLENWWNDDCHFITERSSHWYSLLIRDMNSQMTDTLQKLNMKFKESSYINLEEKSSGAEIYLNIVVPDMTRDVRCLKLWCQLEHDFKGRYLLLNADEFEKKDLILQLCERNLCDFIVINMNESYSLDKVVLYVKPDVCKVILVSDRELSSAMRHKKDIWTLDQLTEKSQSLIMNRMVEFQGNLVRLDSLCSPVILAKSLKTGVMSNLLSGAKIMIGGIFSNTEDFYIPRTLRHQTFLRKEVLLHTHPKDIFAVSAFPTENRLPGALSAVVMSKSIDKFVVDDDRKLFTEICKELQTAKNVHWVVFQGGRLVWKETFGNRTIPQEYIDQMSNECVKETSCCHEELLPDDWRETLRLVTGEPGIGKSSLLRHLTTVIKQKCPVNWVIHVSLNYFSSALKNISPEKMGMKEVLQILYIAAGVENSTCKDLAIALLRDSLERTGKIVIMLDAVDEVSPTYMSQVLCIVRLLLKTRVDKLWVTSRSLLHDVLQRELSSQPLILEPFSEKDQVRFIRYHFPELGDEGPVQIMSLIGIKDDRHICDVPLHALITVESVKLLSSDNDIRFLSLSHIYENFLIRKREVYYKKCGIDTAQTSVLDTIERENEYFMDNHMQCAVSVLFQDENLGKLSNTNINPKFLDEVVKEKSGIIEGIIDGKVKFVHFTFCEFLAAKWILKFYEGLLKSGNEDLENRSQKSILFKLSRKHNTLRSILKRLFEPKFEQVRNFLDEMLSDRFELNQAVLTGNADRVEAVLAKGVNINEQDKGGRTALHLAVSHSNISLVKLLLKSGSSVNVEDFLLYWRPLRYADKIRSWDSAIRLLECGANKDDMPTLRLEAKQRGVWATIKQAISKDKNKLSGSEIQAALNFSFSVGCKELTEVLVMSKRHSGILQEDGCTPLHRAVILGNVNSIRVLLDHGADLHATNILGHSPLHDAARCGHPVVTELLLECGAKSSVQDTIGNTPLHIASRWNQPKSAEVLLKNGADIKAQNKTGDTALHLAAQWGHVEVAQILLAHGAEIASRNKNGKTPLQLSEPSKRADEIASLLC